MTIRQKGRIFGAALLISLCAARMSSAQEPVTPPSTSEAAPTNHKSPSNADAAPAEYLVAKPSEGTQMGLVERFLDDQREIWRGPARLRFSDTEWVVPLGGITAGLFATDRDFSKHLSQNPSTISHYKTLSNGGVAALVGGAGGMWLLGHAKHNEHWSETGFLAGEATLNSLVIVEGMKYSLRRERPFGAGGGSFFQSGGTSFPSEHAAAAWSVAGVIAHEYPGPLTKIMAYGLASLVSVSRVKAHQHFPSDVLVGTVIGNLVAQNIYRRRHDSELGGGEWRSISQIFRSEGNYSAANQGSPYVPLDSWIYSALDRLAGLGLVNSAFVGMRPWTRNECTRLLSEAEDKLEDTGEENPYAARIVEALKREFRRETRTAGSDENAALRLESVYSRVENISGRPINDGFHFAQTQINDFGRPYGEGWNTVAGFSGYATRGPWVAYVRGEWQTAPGTPALALAARETIHTIDDLPQLSPAVGRPSLSQLQLLDAYVGMTLSNWQISFGKQSLWWGPGDGGPMMFSDNSVPLNMFRVNRVAPLKLPSILGWLGQMRTEFFLGQLSGYEFILSPSGFVGHPGQSLARQPFLHGQKISFKPTRNFEFGFFRTTVYGGAGYPLTSHTLLRSLLSTGNDIAGSPVKPGDRRSGLDFSYRLPRMRKWLTFYGDGFADDEFSPIAYFDRSAWHAGLYLSQFPRVQKLDLRVEGVYTDNPLGGQIGHGFYYSNGTWRSGYRQNGNLIGSWIGREGQGAQGWATYHFSPQSSLQLSVRHQKVSQEFILGGGTLTDVGVKCIYQFRSNLGLSAAVQHEQWLFPVIAQAAQRNITTSVQLTYWPHQSTHGAKN
jgi:membrane-associated phospholipid phosphatase